MEADELWAAMAYSGQRLCICASIHCVSMGDMHVRNLLRDA